MMCDTDIARNLGIRYKVDVVSAAVREFLKEYQYVSLFVHVNMYEDHAAIRDNLIGRELNIYFREGGIVYCDECEKAECEHITYALNPAEVTNPLRRREWVRH